MSAPPAIDKRIAQEEKWSKQALSEVLKNWTSPVL